MASSKKRDHLEQLLKHNLKKAEQEVAADPNMQQMITKVRELYLHDKEDFLQALSPNASPPPKRPNLPDSKIPHLIALIDQIGKNTPQVKPIEASEPSPAVEISAPTADSETPSMSSGQLKRQIEKITVEINKAKEVYDYLKKEETAINQRQGKYAVPHERLKCQRLLREIPGRINYLTTIRQQFEEEMKSK